MQMCVPFEFDYTETNTDLQYFLVPSALDFDISMVWAYVSHIINFCSYGISSFSSPLNYKIDTAILLP